MPAMIPIELFHEARLTEALAAQDAVVAAKPDDAGERLTLCEFLSFAGRRNEVHNHLAAIAVTSDAVADYLAGWRVLVAAENERFFGGPPQFLIPPPDHVSLRHRGLVQIGNGIEEGLDLLAEAEEGQPWIEGFVDGRPFEGWRDTDDGLSTVLEVIANEGYTWLPFEQIEKLRLAPVAVLRDTQYRPATVWLTDGQVIDLYVFGLYRGTENHEEDGLRIGAGVDWVERHDVMCGIGLKTFLFGEEELSLDEFTQVEVR